MSKKNLGKKILHFPLTKILIGLIVCGVIAAVGQALTKRMLDLTSIDKDLKNLIGGIIVAILVIISYTY